MAKVVLILPFPPGLNNLFKNIRRGRAPTERYKAWTDEAQVAIGLQRPTALNGPFRVSMTFHRPDRRARDLDNLAKAPLDALVKAGVIEDDSLAVEIRLAWADAPPTAPGSMIAELEVANG